MQHSLTIESWIQFKFNGLFIGIILLVNHYFWVARTELTFFFLLQLDSNLRRSYDNHSVIDDSSEWRESEKEKKTGKIYFLRNIWNQVVQIIRVRLNKLSLSLSLLCVGGDIFKARIFFILFPHTKTLCFCLLMEKIYCKKMGSIDLSLGWWGGVLFLF